MLQIQSTVLEELVVSSFSDATGIGVFEKFKETDWLFNFFQFHQMVLEFLVVPRSKQSELIPAPVWLQEQDLLWIPSYEVILELIV